MMPTEIVKRAAVSRIDVRSSTEFDVYLQGEGGQEIALTKLTGFTLDVQLGQAPRLSVHMILPTVQAVALAETLISMTTHDELIERMERRQRRAKMGDAGNAGNA